MLQHTKEIFKISICYQKQNENYKLKHVIYEFSSKKMYLKEAELLIQVNETIYLNKEHTL